jgi:poly-gamma-glutamate synthesis protein (capsule biosynthesis protein)
MTRSVFFHLLILVILIFSGCSSSLPETPPATPDPQHIGFSGRVVDMDGLPVPGASIESEFDTTISNQDGWFDLPGNGAPQWITVKSDGFISRTRAVMPGVPALFRLSNDDGKTIVIQFGGDTMFGRRFFDPNEDGDITDGLLPVDPDVESHLKLLTPIKPLLGMADLTVLNFESPLTDKPYFSTQSPRPTTYHPTKDYIFSSDINAIKALKQMGVDVVDIGNNHLYDLLENGLQSTISALDEDNMNYFGGGINESSAWAPSIMTIKGQKIGFIGCTTIARPIPPVTTNDVTYVASDALQKGGAAFCEESILRSAITRAKQDVDMVVVMIHGGFEYVRSPSNNVARLTMAARDSGAILVINHHPHVVGSFLWDQKALIAWSMGNFIFDQKIWPTFESYMLTVYLRNGEVIRAHVDPLMIDSYLPHGLTGPQADYVARIAATNFGPYVMEDGTMEIDVDGRAIENKYTRAMDGGLEPGQIITIPQSQWISNFTGTGNLLLGRDLLWVGGFETNKVNDNSHGAPLWDLTKENIKVGQDYAYEGLTGIRLSRGASNLNDAVTSHLHRILVNPNTNLSITGMMRANPGAVVLMQMSWYSDLNGPSFLQTTEIIQAQAIDQWESFRIDTEVPLEAIALNVFLRLTPPFEGTVTSDFDNIRIIEWAPDDASYSPYYTDALLIGEGDLTLTQAVLPGAEQWITPPLANQNK